MPLVPTGCLCLIAWTHGDASFQGRGGGSGICRTAWLASLEEGGIPCLLLMKRLSWRDLAINPFMELTTSLFVDVETGSRASWKQRIVGG